MMSLIELRGRLFHGGAFAREPGKTLTPVVVAYTAILFQLRSGPTCGPSPSSGAAHSFTLEVEPPVSWACKFLPADASRHHQTVESMPTVKLRPCCNMETWEAGASAGLGENNWNIRQDSQSTSIHA